MFSRSVARSILALALILVSTGCQSPIDIQNNEVPPSIRAQAESLNGDYTLVYNYALNPRREVGSFSVRNANGRFEITGDFRFIGPGWEFSRVTRIFWPEAGVRASTHERRLLVILELSRVRNGRPESKTLNLSLYFDASGRLEREHALRYSTSSINRTKYHTQVERYLQVIRN